jgi:hypothetical protein
MTLKSFALLAGLVIVAGCATGAQRQAQQSAVGAQEAAAQFKACWAPIIVKPEYTPLLPHNPDPETSQPTMVQLTDERLPSQEEAKLWAARHDEMASCRMAFARYLYSVRPDLAAVFTDGWIKGDAIAVDLVERKITWGEGARRTQGALNEFQQKLTATNRQWIADVNASNQAEIAQRQAAAAAMMQWSAQQQQSLAQQQMINAMNRPVFVQQPARLQTTCMTNGNMMNCN